MRGTFPRQMINNSCSRLNGWSVLRLNVRWDSLARFTGIGATGKGRVAMETSRQGFNLWSVLTAPNKRITDIEMRRQSTLLAGLMLAVIALSSLAAILMSLRGGITSTVASLWGGISIS